MAIQNQVRDIVSSVLKRHFEHMKVESIEVAPGFDDDGNRVVEIKIIFDARVSVLTAQETTRLIGIIVSKMDEMDIKSGSDTGFPLLSFIAKSELEKRNTDPA